MVALIDFESAGISRARLMKELESRGIGTQVHYIPLHRMPAFRAIILRRTIVSSRIILCPVSVITPCSSERKTR